MTLEFYYTFYFKSEKRSKVKFCKFSALEFRHILRKKTFTTVLKNILNDRGKQKQSLDLLSHNTITAYFFPLDIPWENLQLFNPTLCLKEIEIKEYSQYIL